MTVVAGPWRWLAARPAGWTAWRIHANFRCSGRRPWSHRHPTRSNRTQSKARARARALALVASGRLPCRPMDRPRSFEHTRFLGDKRTQLVYDLDEWDD